MGLILLIFFLDSKELSENSSLHSRKEKQLHQRESHLFSYVLLKLLLSLHHYKQTECFLTLGIPKIVKKHIALSSNITL